MILSSNEFTPLETLAMLDQNTSAQLKTLLERLEGPIEIVATLNGTDKSDKIKELVTEVAAFV